MNCSHFSYLDEIQKNKINRFLNSHSFVVVEQSPDWLNETKQNIRYFVCESHGIIGAYAKVYEKRKFFINLTAVVHFGPVWSNLKSLTQLIEFIKDYYKDQRFLSLSIQPVPLSYESMNTIETTNLVDLNSKQEVGWATIIVNLNCNKEELYKNISKGHKSAIKKSEKLGMIVSPINDKSEFIDLSNLYYEMRLSRKLTADRVSIENKFEFLQKYLKDENNGKAFKVIDNAKKVIGGVVNIRQGKNMRYYLGASNPKFRDLPISHLAIWQSIIYSKTVGLDYYDLWGYTLQGYGADQQLLNINTFKKGFGGEVVKYPDKLIFESVKHGITIQKTIEQYSNLLRRILS